MRKVIKKKLLIVILFVLIVNAVIGYTLFKNRMFSHLAVWDTVESDKSRDFYWPPQNAPEYFRFEPDSDKISGFREEILPLVKDERDEFKKITGVAKHVMDIGVSRFKLQAPSFKLQDTSLRWDSPEGMLRQIKQGASANCFHRAILFSTYLSSMGIKSRLWALENDNFNAAAHSINEVYINALKKWVFIDVMFGFYVIGNDGVPLSFLEFREKLLNGNSNEILLQSIHNEIKSGNSVWAIYRRLIKCVFLRADNDFADRYSQRYGIFNFAQKYIDRFPDNIKRGLEYLLEKRKFIHYTDGFSKSLRLKIVLAKLSFYFLVFSLTAAGIFSAGLLCKILSRKDTCQI